MQLDHVQQLQRLQRPRELLPLLLLLDKCRNRVDGLTFILHILHAHLARLVYTGLKCLYEIRRPSRL